MTPTKEQNEKAPETAASEGEVAEAIEHFEEKYIPSFSKKSKRLLKVLINTSKAKKNMQDLWIAAMKDNKRLEADRKLAVADLLCIKSWFVDAKIHTADVHGWVEKGIALCDATLSKLTASTRPNSAKE